MSDIVNKIFLAINLIRLSRPTGFLLCFFPAAFGVMLAGGSAGLYLLPKMLLGAILARSSGCIIGDLWDRNIDSKVERTKNRPLANKKLSPLFALILLLCTGAGALLVLFSLPPIAIKYGLATIPLIALYPLAKRYTHLAQLALGVAFNMGVFIGYAAADQNAISPAAWVMYSACIFWTLGYDTIYGFMDIKDDKKIGAKSMARLLEKKNPKLWLYLFYAAFIILFGLSITIEYNLYKAKFIDLHTSIKILFPLLLLLYPLAILLAQLRFVDPSDPNSCMKSFNSNNFAGLLLIMPLLVLP